MRQTTEFARFFLYGEPPRPASGRFIHLEHLDDRSRPANWIIRPHAHPDLHHLFIVEAGGGQADGDGRRIVFNAPCMIGVPAGVVHGFRWVADTQGSVATFADAFLREISAKEPALARMFGDGLWTAPLSSVSAEAVAALLRRLSKELGWRAAGHDLAVEACLGALLVEALRSREAVERGAHAPPGPQALLVARYRDLLDAHFREHPTIEWSAARLSVTPGRLRAACRAVARRSPAQMLHDRLAVEAQRVMRYSNMSVAQVATYLGFGDPAYFSRFFTKACGASPRAYRADQVKTPPDR